MGLKVSRVFGDHFVSVRTGKNIPPFPCDFNFLGTIYSDFFNIIVHAFPQFLISSLKQSSGLRQMCFLYLVFFLLLEQPLLLLLFFLQLLFQLFLTFKKLPFLLKEIFFSKFTFSILFIKLKILGIKLRQLGRYGCLSLSALHQRVFLMFFRHLLILFVHQL